MIELPRSRTFDRRIPHDVTRDTLTASRQRFVEGISLYVFPGRAGRNETIEFTMHGDDIGVRDATQILRALSRRPARDVTSTVCEAGNKIAAGLCASGSVTYELTAADGVLGLHHVSRLDATRVLGVYAAIGKGGRGQGGSSTWLKVAYGRRFWFLKLPSELGGVWRHRRLLRDLGRIGEFMPMWSLRLLRQNRYDALDGTVDRDAYMRAYAEFITSETKRWGWYADNTYMRYCSEYYGLLRWLQATHARIRLRDHIVREMNVFFARVGLSARVSMVAGKTLQECEAKIDELSRGDVATADLMDWIRGSNVV